MAKLDGANFDWEAAAQNPPRPEHPRPRLVRSEWQSLNGVWEFGTDPARVGLTRQWFDGRPMPGKIVVPFAHQWPLSGRGNGHGDPAVEEVVWYARTFTVPDAWREAECDVLLHFGAVDYQCTVWVNGQEIGHNVGGHVPFSFDIAPYIREGENRLCVRVEDLQDPYQPRGKQAVNAVPRGCDYHCTTGIWQSVWIEHVPCLRIEDVVLTPELGADPADDALEVRVLLHAPALDLRARVRVFDGDRPLAEREVEVNNGHARCMFRLPNAPRWSPDAPNLLDVTVDLMQGDVIWDTVRTYAGLRSVSLKNGEVLLNGALIKLLMVLDQGYWPESGMTAPTDEALRADVEWCRKFGFNGARKHQKVEDPRWLYWCDRLGLLVWGEMANARAWCPEAEDRLAMEWERAVRRDVSHPCVITWVPMNESWGVPSLDREHPGQYAFVERLVTLTRRLDGTRPVVDNDGWEHTDVGDLYAIHDYTPTGDGIRERYRETLGGGPMLTTGWGKRPKSYLARGARYRGQPVILSEIGGFLTIPDDVPAERRDWLYSSYGTVDGPDQLIERYRDLLTAIAELPFVAGFCYTQLTDLQQEMNGLLTFDRRPKLDPSRLAALHEELFG